MNDIGWAVQHLLNGSKVSRMGWNHGDAEHRTWLELHRPNPTTKIIYASLASGELVPWAALQADILSTDWEVLL